VAATGIKKTALKAKSKNNKTVKIKTLLKRLTQKTDTFCWMILRD